MAETVSRKILSELSGVSGCEGKVRGYIKEIIAPLCDSMTTDAMGSLIALRRGRSDRRRAMLCAGMDEAGLIVSGITDDGYIKLKAAGGIDPRLLVSKRIVTGGGVKGVIGMKAIHLQTKDERKAAVRLDSLYADIGMTKKSAAEKAVALGDYVTFDTKYSERGGVMRGKALGRLGITCLVKAMETVPAYDTYFVFAAQSRIEGRGIRCAAYAVKPDIVLTVDAASAQPPCIGGKCVTGYAEMGGGAVIKHYDRTNITAEGAAKAIAAAARRHGIETAHAVCLADSGGAGAALISAGGCYAAEIGLPYRYKDSPAGFMSLNDLEGAQRLCAAFVEESDVILNDISKNG